MLVSNLVIVASSMTHRYALYIFMCVLLTNKILIDYYVGENLQWGRITRTRCSSTNL